jgi:hypothetical protein
MLDRHYINSTELNTGLFANAHIYTVIDIATALMLERGDMTPEQTLADIQLVNDEIWVKLV